MKRILSLVLCALMTVSTLAFTASASQGESPRADGDTIVYDYKDIFSELVNKATNADVDKEATFDGRTVVKITPPPTRQTPRCSLSTTTDLPERA